MFAQISALEHPNNSLAQGLLVAAVNRVCGATATRVDRYSKLLAGQSVCRQVPACATRFRWTFRAVRVAVSVTSRHSKDVSAKRISPTS